MGSADRVIARFLELPDAPESQRPVLHRSDHAVILVDAAAPELDGLAVYAQPASDIQRKRSDAEARVLRVQSLQFGLAIIKVRAVKAGADINSILNGNAEELARLMASREIGEPLEEAFSYLDAAGYNYAVFRYEADAAQYPHRVMLGAECYPGALYENWKICEKLPQLIGDFGWTAWDYLCLLYTSDAADE